MDPRFSEPVDESLSAARLREWCEAVLVNRSKEKGGKCKEVKIENLTVNATGLRPWSLRARKESKMGKARGEFWSIMGFPCCTGDPSTIVELPGHLHD